ncbi:hypothetical protein [Actinokineospora iranica]|uniref:Uncharacterized protein n=1 Tax=Actinokineospora iranica TaxID=1271860 RepID=A0A1G6UZT3_9PSEU|nr:hypothetical protein [Actinokineospora iranica]SDD46156.1 hypothetical protein SAMN05216174_111145 [Actinokineospora iranica]
MDARGYAGLQTVVFFVGLYEGVVPFVAKVFDWEPFLAFPLRLPNPAWWIVSAAAILVSIVLLDLLERGKKRVS